VNHESQLLLQPVEVIVPEGGSRAKGVLPDILLSLRVGCERQAPSVVTHYCFFMALQDRVKSSVVNSPFSRTEH
jgi:hypothetical protein